MNCGDYGIYLYSSQNNLIYNNLFNNTNNFYFKGNIYPNSWNTTKQLGQRIYSPGNYIGGNYWTNPTGNGFSDTCTDADNDEFCDSSYTLNSTGPNIDYLPLSNKYSQEDTKPPTYSLNSTNSTIAGTAVSHNLYWQDNAGLSYAIFSFDNCTGILQNITGMSLSGSSAWSNFTVVINSTVGCTIRWCVYVNDTSNNWNRTSCENPFSYVTTSGKCTYSSGNWIVNCSDNCVITSPVNLNNNDLILIGAGTFTVQADILAIGDIQKDNECVVIKKNDVVMEIKNG
jgi:hypothetical protein